MKNFLLLSICLLLSSISYAHDFEVDGIYYRIISSVKPYTAEVTCRGYSYDEYDNEYTGAVKIPSTVTYNGKTYKVIYIGTGSFRGCTALTSVDIPNSVTIIINGAFAYCPSLTSITIPESVTGIGWNAFDGSGLTSIIVDPKNTVYDSRQNCNAIIETSSNTLIAGCRNTIIPNSVTRIDNYAFSYHTGFTFIDIPYGVVDIGPCAFWGCSDLKSCHIAESVTTIGAAAFRECNLTSITIPSSVTSIDGGAFMDNKNLSSVISYIQNPFEIEDDCFRWGAILYVPYNSLSLYQNLKNWKRFKKIIPFGGNYVEAKKEDLEVVFKNSIPEQMELNGIVIGDTYYNISTENGDGFDATNGCLVLNSQTSDADVDAIAGKPISDESVKNTFKGFIIKVPAGNGIFNVTAKTTGASALKVKIGNKTAQAYQLAEQGNVEIPYTVVEPSYVYVYAGIGATLAKNTNVTTTNAENSVNIYGYNWKKEESTGISIISSEPIPANNVSGIYTLNGCKLNGKLAQKGIYIMNGKKMVVK